MGARNVSSLGRKRARRHLRIASTALTIAMFIEGMLIVYGAAGLLGVDVLNDQVILVNVIDGLIYSGIFLSAGTAFVATSKALHYFTKLHKKQHIISHKIWYPVIASIFFVLLQFLRTVYHYDTHLTLLVVSYLLAMFAGVIPAVVLSAKDVRKLQGVSFWDESDTSKK